MSRYVVMARGMPITSKLSVPLGSHPRPISRTQRIIPSVTSTLPISRLVQNQRRSLSNVQRVRFKKPGFRGRSLAISLLAFYVSISLYSKLVLDPLEQAAEEALKHIPDAELEEEAGKPLFIPFPGTTKQLDQKPYRGSDPEWQEFIKFSKDVELAKSVRNELAAFVCQVADRHPVLIVRCGKGMQIRRYWLDVDFPTVPPPEFERSGIEISDDRIEWKTMPVDFVTVSKIRQALWPSALAQSFWSFTKVLVVNDAYRIGQILGISSGPPSNPVENMIKAFENLQKGLPAAKDSPPTQPRSVAEAAKAIANPQTSEKSSLNGKRPEEVEVGPTDRILSAFRAHFFSAMMAFKGKLNQTWKPALSYPPRGSILVSGLVELEAPRALLVFDVRAAWDPKAKSYDAKSMHVQLRRLQMKKQAPLGGS